MTFKPFCLPATSKNTQKGTQKTYLCHAAGASSLDREMQLQDLGVKLGRPEI